MMNTNLLNEIFCEGSISMEASSCLQLLTNMYNQLKPGSSMTKIKYQLT